MKRPSLIHFTAVKNDQDISIKAFISDKSTPSIKQTIPIRSIALIKRKSYQVKLNGLDKDKNIIFQKNYETDSFGIIELKISLDEQRNDIKFFQVYETSLVEGISFMLGTFYVSDISTCQKIVISDFDKTLCDTKFSTLPEIYGSLKTPLNEFPTVKASIDLLNTKIEDSYIPFILSASPHFYEKAMTDWLYQNKIYTSHIYLKDYRNFFSLDRGILSLKDVKKQGFYKLNQLVKILSMTAIPDDLCLIGDGFESDSLIYLTIYAILVDKKDPWFIWNKLKNDKVFKLTSKQHSLFLSKFYQLSEQIKRKQSPNIDIHIRCTASNIEEVKRKKYGIDFIDENLAKVNFYVG